jgi:hypothetical protein
MRLLMLSFAFLATSFSVAIAAPKPPTGDQVLAKATSFKGLTSYSVPVQFKVHVHKPIGVRVGVEGTAYYRAPGDAALQITKAPAIVGGLFRGTYQLDVVPQAWPSHYHITAVAKGADPTGAPMLTLTGVPRAPGDVTQVVFTIVGGAATSAQWSYKDGSSIAVTFLNAPVGGYLLPASAKIDVNTKTNLTADATYGDYALNTPVDDSTLTATK